MELGFWTSPYFKKTFLKGFNLELEKNATLVWNELVMPILGKRAEKRATFEASVKEWCKWLERPRNKWGDSPLEKALANIFIPFLSVT